MLDLLMTRDDAQFEGFCAALEATDQAHIVEKYLQKHRVCVVIEQYTNTSVNCDFHVLNL